MSVTGQAPMALQSVPGVDIMQSGVNDFNVNARGFNSTLNRRVLTLQDGRDLAIAFLGSQEWNGHDPAARGAGQGGDGAGARQRALRRQRLQRRHQHHHPEAREVLGNKFTIAGGELETFRADGRHASLLADGRIGLRLNGGYNRERHLVPLPHLATARRSSRSMRRRPTSRCRSSRERLPLDGQTADPVTGEVSGDRDPLRNIYGAAGSTTTWTTARCSRVDGGAARVENEIFVTGIGRVQVGKAIKPYARAAWAAERFNIFGFWNSRTSLDPQFSLTSGLPLEERSDIFHLEGQTNWNFQARSAAGWCTGPRTGTPRSTPPAR